MSKFKKAMEVCAVEIMIGGGFLITGVLCAIAGTYDGAAVCGVVAIVAGVIGVLQWRKQTRRLGLSEAVAIATATQPQNRKPAKAPPPLESPFPKRRVTKPRRVVKAKKKAARK